MLKKKRKRQKNLRILRYNCYIGCPGKWLQGPTVSDCISISQTASLDGNQKAVVMDFDDIDKALGRALEGLGDF